MSSTSAPGEQILRGLTLTPREAADLLGCSLSMVYKLLVLGELDGYHVGRLKRIFRASVAEYTVRQALPKPQQDRPQAEQPQPCPRKSRRQTGASTPFRHLS